MRYGQKKVPQGFYLVIFGYLTYCLFFTPNFWTTLPVALYPLFAFRLLWVDKQPNVLFFGMMMQWLSASTQILYSNIINITLEERVKDTAFPGYEMDNATVLSLTGLFFFTFGLYWVIRKIQLKTIDEALSFYSPKKVLRVYVCVSVTIYFTQGIIWNFPSVVQYFYFFFFIKWGFFIVAFYIIHKKAPLLRTSLYGILTVEVLLSFASFFAGEFVNIASFIVLGFILLQPKLTIRSYLFIAIGGGCVLYFLILWSAVKPEYRSYVSNGQLGQSVQVSRFDANSKLYDLITNVNDDQYSHAIETFVDRLGYIQYFAASLDHVPKNVPYQNGTIYLSAVQHYLVPRFLNPNKAVLDDSKHTTEFTGIQVSGAETATSFSLGYIADAYIDFGPIYMNLILFAFGGVFGFFYRYLYTKSINEFWVWIVTAPFFLLININGADTKKALGWILIYFLVVAIVRKQLTKRIDPLMRS